MVAQKVCVVILEEVLVKELQRVFNWVARVCLEYTLEAQHPMWLDNLIGAIFWDAGQVDLKTLGFTLEEFRHGLGAGVGYALPMGIMRLDVGVPLGRKEWESAFQIHFDFGATF